MTRLTRLIMHGIFADAAVHLFNHGHQSSHSTIAHLPGKFHEGRPHSTSFILPCSGGPCAANVTFAAVVLHRSNDAAQAYHDAQTHKSFLRSLKDPETAAALDSDRNDALGRACSCWLLPPPLLA